MTCNHERYHLCKKPIANGKFHKLAQCDVCGARLNIGENASCWLKLEQGEIWEDLPLFDAKLYLEGEKAAASARMEKHMMEGNKRWLEKHKKYEDYILGSDTWKRRRERVLWRCRGWCEACLERKAVQVHHITYSNLFCEPLWDLKGVCLECHAMIHQKGLKNGNQ